jgi:hypothetical protein
MKVFGACTRPALFSKKGAFLICFDQWAQPKRLQRRFAGTLAAAASKPCTRNSIETERFKAGGPGFHVDSKSD